MKYEAQNLARKKFQKLTPKFGLLKKGIAWTTVTMTPEFSSSLAWFCCLVGGMVTGAPRQVTWPSAGVPCYQRGARPPAPDSRGGHSIRRRAHNKQDRRCALTTVLQPDKQLMVGADLGGILGLSWPISSAMPYYLSHTVYVQLGNVRLECIYSKLE